MSGKRATSLTDSDGNHGGWIIDCPACGYCHLFDQRWKFNGNEELPTFTPSMLVNAELHKRDPSKWIRCHSYITDGRIQFLGDCSHSMAGQTVDLPTFDGSGVA